MTTGTDAGKIIKFSIEASSDLWIFGYGTTVSSYVPSTGVTTVLKDDFTDDVTDAVKWGSWIYIASGIAGDKVTYMVIATSAFTEIATAPKCERLFLFDRRLVCGNTDTNISEVHYSRQDQQSGVPWSGADDWTMPGANRLAEDEGTVTFDNAEGVAGFGTNDNQLVTILDKGRLGFRITVIDAATIGLVQDVPIDFQKLGFGGTRGITATSKGIYYINDHGVWIISPGGAQESGNAKIDHKLTTLLGEDFFKNYDSSDSDIVAVETKDLVLVSTRDNSAANNTLLVFDEVAKSWMIWKKAISRFMKIDQEVYGTSSTDTTIFKLFDGSSSASAPMYTIYEQEVPIGAFDELYAMDKFICGGRLSDQTTITIEFDIYDRQWKKLANVASLTWTADGITRRVAGVRSSGVRRDGVRGRIDGITGMIESLLSYNVATRDFLRLVLRFTSQDKSPHEINFFSVLSQFRGIVGQS